MKESGQTSDQAPAAYLLTWDPARYAFPNISAAVRATAAGTDPLFDWSVGDASVAVGDRVFLMRHGEDQPGLVGSGTIKSDVSEGPHWDTSKPEGLTSRFADVAWEVLCEFPLVPLSELQNRTNERHLWTKHGNGFLLEPGLARTVEHIWHEAQLSPRALRLWPAVQVAKLLTARELACYRSDVAAREDQLGVLSDVENLCQVIMAKQWKPPLSIGLFGDWGSGKTSFINLLHSTIDAAATQARGAKDSAFVSDIIQIEFNAWHYLDANLWANLVVRILDGIYNAVFEHDPVDRRADDFRQIVGHLHMLQEEVERTEGQSKQLEVAVRQVDAQIETKRGERQTAMDKISTLKVALSDTDNAIAKEVANIKSALCEAAGGLGLDSGAELSDVRSLAQKLSRTSERFRSAWGRMRKRRLLWLLLPIATLALLLEVRPILSWITELPSVRNALTAVATLLTLALSWTRSLAPHLKTIKKGLGAVEKVLSRVGGVRQGWQKAKQEELTKLEGNRAAAVSEIERLEGRRTEARQEQEELEERLEQLMQGQGLEEFLLSRAGSADYREQLGIIALVHKDMEELQRKLQAGLEVELDGKTEKRRYDRVILYIDDLDRCTPERVVEVLQAVHLLLSIPLFVVIVAADPRWLLQCLLTHYQDLLHTDDDIKTFGWSVTPQDYLGKIFQIPYALPPMASRDFESYVAHLFSTEDTTGEAGASEIRYHELQSEVELREIKTRRLRQQAADGQRAQVCEQQVELDRARQELREALRELRREQRNALPAPLRFGTNPAALNVPTDEREFVRQLLPLLTTPRVTKRLLNVYRLIRVSLDTAALEAFERREHEAVLVLLAVMYSFPEIAVKFLADLHNADARTIEEYVQQKSARHDDDWARLSQRLDEVRCVQDIDIYRRWVDIVGRFSFQVGHGLTRRQG